MKKKILVYGLSNTRGGIENYIVSMQKQLQSEFSFMYLLEKCNCIYKADIEENGGSLHFWENTESVIQKLLIINRMLKQFRKITDILYVNVSDISYQTLVVIMIGIRYKYRIVVHSHNAMLEPILSKLHCMTHHVIEKICVHICKLDGVICIAVSDKAGQYLFKNGKYEVVHAGIDVKKFLFDIEKRNRIRNQYNISDAILYGFIGRLAEVKNPYFVLDVFSEILCKNQKQCKLIIVGGGPLEEGIREEIYKKGMSDNVIFVGEVTNVDEYLNAIDFIISPSLSEGMSLTLMEAQASGVPCLCSKDRIPKDIKVTPLVEFALLEEGKEFWAQRCIELAEKFRDNNRKKWNEVVHDTDFELYRVAAILKSKLL